MFGSDFLTQRVLSKLAQDRLSINKLEVVCPPNKKPRTPLAELHNTIQKYNLSILHEFGTDKEVQWK